MQMIKPKDLKGWRKIEQNEIWYALEYHKRMLLALSIFNAIMLPIGVFLILNLDDPDVFKGLFCLSLMSAFWSLVLRDYTKIRLGHIKVLDVTIKRSYLDPRGCPYPPLMVTKYDQTVSYNVFYCSKQSWLCSHGDDVECLFFCTFLGKVVAIKREARF